MRVTYVPMALTQPFYLNHLCCLFFCFDVVDQPNVIFKYLSNTISILEIKESHKCSIICLCHILIPLMKTLDLKVPGGVCHIDNTDNKRKTFQSGNSTHVPTQ